MQKSTQPVKFLFLRFSSIGDIVLTTPVVRRVKQQMENVEITYLTKPAFAPMLEANPYVDKVVTLDASIKKTAKQLKYHHFDYIIDLHNNLRTWKLKTSLKVLAFAFNKLNYEKWLLVNFKINKLPSVHIVDRYMETVKVFDVQDDGKGLDHFIPTGTAPANAMLPPFCHKGYVGLVLGANHATKQLSEEKLHELCEQIDHPVVLLGGKDVQEKGKTLAERFPKHVFNTCGRLSLAESAQVVKEARLIITPDTGLMHIAAALGQKILSIWGNTVPEFGMGPYRAHPDSVIIENKPLSCRPCSKIGFSKCPKKHFKCIQDLSTTEITTHVTRLW